MLMPSSFAVNRSLSTLAGPIPRGGMLMTVQTRYRRQDELVCVGTLIVFDFSAFEKPESSEMM